MTRTFSTLLLSNKSTTTGKLSNDARSRNHQPCIDKVVFTCRYGTDRKRYCTCLRGLREAECLHSQTSFFFTKYKREHQLSGWCPNGFNIGCQQLWFVNINWLNWTETISLRPVFPSSYNLWKCIFVWRTFCYVLTRYVSSTISRQGTTCFCMPGRRSRFLQNNRNRIDDTKSVSGSLKDDRIMLNSSIGIIHKLNGVVWLCNHLGKTNSDIPHRWWNRNLQAPSMMTNLISIGKSCRFFIPFLHNLAWVTSALSKRLRVSKAFELGLLT